MTTSAAFVFLIVCVLSVQTRAADTEPYLLHLPGIGGHMRIDDMVTSGMELGGIRAKYEIHDWTGENTGMLALTSYNKNQLEAQTIADKITQVYRADSKRKIILTSHSGGGGIAVFALEKLPEDVRIDTLLMLAPALSPTYDMTKALKHVTGKVYVFSSTLDPIDGFGTRTFGTMDRVNVDSMGNVGVQRPDKADSKLYEKVISITYDASWTQFGNAGDHIGTMNRAFARYILAPLLLTGKLPKYAPPASQPTTQSDANANAR